MDTDCLKRTRYDWATKLMTVFIVRRITQNSICCITNYVNGEAETILGLTEVSKLFYCCWIFTVNLSTNITQNSNKSLFCKFCNHYYLPCPWGEEDDCWTDICSDDRSGLWREFGSLCPYLKINIVIPALLLFTSHSACWRNVVIGNKVINNKPVRVFGNFMDLEI